MGRPEENFLNYENTELMHYSPLLKGKTLLIVHGTIDRRVNIQQSMQFMKNLASNAIQYRTQVRRLLLGKLNPTLTHHPPPYSLDSSTRTVAPSIPGTRWFAITFTEHWRTSLQSASR